MERISAEMIAAALPIPGVLCIVDKIPNCDSCGMEDKDTPGPYDFPTRMGPWAHGCEQHWQANSMYRELGVGKGQYWLVGKAEPGANDPPDDLAKYGPERGMH